MVQEASVGESYQLSAISTQQEREDGRDEVVSTNDVLQPGQYLVELETLEGRSVGADALVLGLSRMGWSKVCLDASLTVKEDAELQHVRFVGELESLLVPVDTPFLRWVRITRSEAVDVFGELEYRLKPIEVETGRLYELLFIARTKSHRTKDDVLKALADMGFQVDVLSLLKRDMRVPGYPGASAGLWFGLAFWRGPEGYVNADDAFVFEAVEESAVRHQVSTVGQEGEGT